MPGAHGPAGHGADAVRAGGRARRADAAAGHAGADAGADG